jgi:hypothetical protein
MARIVIARMAGLRPGTSPPPVRIAMTPFFVLTFTTADLLIFKMMGYTSGVTCTGHANLVGPAKISFAASRFSTYSNALMISRARRV